MTTASWTTHIRRHAVGYLALFFALGGTASAVATITSDDVVDDSLVSADLKDNAGVTGPDIAIDAVGPRELRRTLFFESGGQHLSDDPGGNPREVVLVDPASFGLYRVVGSCNDAGSGGVTARVFVKPTANNPGSLTVDSDARGGVADTVDVPGSSAVASGIDLARLGPTTGAHFSSGAYAVWSTQSVLPIAGVVSVGTHVAGPDCSFAITATG